MSSPVELTIPTATNTSQPASPPTHPSTDKNHFTHQPSRLPFIITSLYLGTFLVALDTTILNPALPAITKTFHALDHLAWYGSAYLLALTALQPVVGKVYNIGNIKRLYLGCVGVFEVGSILCAAAPSSAVFIACRAVAGCGAAGLMQGSFTIITKTVPLSKRPFYFGFFVSAFGVSIGIGPVLGGMFADRGMWPWCFWINLPLGAVVIGLVALFLKLPNNSDEKTRAVSISMRSARQSLFELDLGGTILLVASICSLFMAMQWGGHSLKWSSPTIIGLFTTFGVLLWAFLLLEWKMGDDACVPFRVLQQRSIASGAVYLFLFSMPNFSYGVYIPIFFQAVKGFTAQRSGAEILFLSLTQILVVIAVGALVSKFGYYTPFIISGTALSVIGSGLITRLSIHTAHGAWAAYFIICGIGTGSAINLPYTSVSVVLKEEDMVTGNALLQFAFQLGGAVSLCISQTLFLRRLALDVRSHLPNEPVEAAMKDATQGMRSAYSSEESRLLSLASQNAVGDVFVFLLVMNGLAFIVSLAFEHKNIKRVERERKSVAQTVQLG